MLIGSWFAETGVSYKVEGLNSGRTSTRSLCGIPTASEDILKSHPLATICCQLRA